MPHECMRQTQQANILKEVNEWVFQHQLLSSNGRLFKTWLLFGC